MHKIKSKKVKIIIVSCIVVVLVYLGYTYLMPKKDIDMSSNIQPTNLSEYPVSLGNLSVSVTGSGSVNPSDKRIIKSEIDGTIDNIFVKEGDLVESDQVLLSLKTESKTTTADVNEIKLAIEQSQRELNKLYENQSELNIYANSSGIISGFDLKIGDNVTSNTDLFSIKDTDYTYAETYFIKNEFDNIEIGDKATIFINSFFTTEIGEVTAKNDTPVQLGGGTFGYKVTVKMKNPGGLTSGLVTDISVDIGTGTVEGMQKGVTIESEKKEIQSTVAGKVSEIKTENGKYVNTGDLLLTLKIDDMDYLIAQQKNEIEKNKEKLNDLLKEEGDTVYAPTKGTILSVSVKDEEVVDRNAALITMADLDNMEVIIAVDELDITKISLGQMANITCDVFKDEVFTGQVSKISLEGKNSNGVTTYDITVKLDVRKNLMSGMNVDIEVIGNSREGVLIVPIDAVEKTDAGYIVMVKGSDGATSPVNVELGLATKNEVEIVSGLKEGDVVVYTKKQSNMPDNRGPQAAVMTIGFASE